MLVFTLIFGLISLCYARPTKVERELIAKEKELAYCMRGLPPGSELVKYYGNFWLVFEHDGKQFIYRGKLHETVMARIN